MKKTLLIITMLFILLSCGKNNIIDTSIENEEEKNYKILAIGDSLTAGYNLEYYDSYPLQLNTILEDKGYDYEVINAGVSGDTSKNLLSRINLYKDDYQVVLLNVGGNDGLRSLSTDELKKNILNIIDNFRDTKIVLFGIDLPANYSILYRNKLKQVYTDINEEREVYYYGLFFEDLDYSKHFLNDGVHPNTEGYGIIANNIADYLIENKIIIND